jgi:hypothetical protein
MPPFDWQAAGGRIDRLVTTGHDEDLVRAVTDLYGAGLERLLDLLHETGTLTDAAVAAIAGDDLVAGLLAVHGLHPYDAATRIRRALAGTGVELAELTAGGRCRIRVRHGHQPPPGVEQRIEAAAPEITGIEVVPVQPVIPVAALFTRVAAP